MYKYDFKELERVNKTQAAALYNAGFEVLFIPCNLNPENTFYRLGIWENKQLEGQAETFEKLCNAFTYYNCNRETGLYIAFYVKKHSFIHFQFVDGANPYFFRGSVLECMKELKKWSKYWNMELLQPGYYRLEGKQ